MFSCKEAFNKKFKSVLIFLFPPCSWGDRDTMLIYQFQNGNMEIEFFTPLTFLKLSKRSIICSQPRQTNQYLMIFVFILEYLHLDNKWPCNMLSVLHFTVYNIQQLWFEDSHTSVDNFGFHASDTKCMFQCFEHVSQNEIVPPTKPLESGVSINQKMDCCPVYAFSHFLVSSKTNQSHSSFH